jgi:putative nucleotidyltransferase with HDIG domain
MVDLLRTYSDQLKQGQVVKFDFYRYTPDINELTLNLVSQSLAQLQLTFLQEVLFTFLKELINNAIKANLKRAFFKSQNEDIHNCDKHDELILKFKEEILTNVDKLMPTIEKENLKVEISMQLNNKYKISVKNNTSISEDELERVTKRLSLTEKFESVDEIFEEILDNKEGAGMGLAMGVMLLKNSGIGLKSFQFKHQKNSTKSVIAIPKTISKPKAIRDIQKKIVNIITGIPTFPEIINQVIQICDDPKSSMSQVTRKIEKDPALASDILRISNSPSFLTKNRNETLSSAVTILGLKEIRYIAVASASRKILNAHFKIFKGFWEHAYKCAFYAKLLAEKFAVKKDAEAIYLGGLLHDLGKIVLFAIKPALIKKIDSLRDELTKRNTSTLEEVSIGVSHVVIGAQIAEKWNFAPSLIEMIANHHCPFAADEQNRMLINIIHLADALANVEVKKGKYVYIDITVSDALGLKKEKDFSSLHNYLKTRYEELSQ